MIEKKLITIDKTEIELTNLNKILFPKSDITKKDLINYYYQIYPLILPFIQDRPITMFRYPNGINKEYFVQKNISDFFPKWIKTATVSKKNNESIKMLICNDLKTLIYLVNLACITPHIWLSYLPKLKTPDRLIFDLDPPNGKIELVIEGALDLKELLQKEFSISAYIMTTGSRGVHIVVPIAKELSFEKVKLFAKKIAEILVEKKPKLYTIEMRKEKRNEKLFIDYHRNAYAQTVVAPYAVRAIESAPVAVPIEWIELKKLNIKAFNIKTVLKRDKKVWSDFFKKKYSLKKMI
jgi:bifunctional non-homologous end joining protein LigD